MKTRILPALVIALVAASPATAQQLFDFLGQADVPTTVGGQLTFAGLIRDPAPAGSTPLPLDFANYEYTVVVSGLTLAVDGLSQTYTGGTVTIYRDDATTADSSVPGTFDDGTAILVGDLPALTRTVFPAGIGNATGAVDWVGGTRLDDLAPVDRLNWAFLAAVNVGLAASGHDELWDGKLESLNPIVDTETLSWGDLKSQLR